MARRWWAVTYPVDGKVLADADGRARVYSRKRDAQSVHSGAIHAGYLAVCKVEIRVLRPADGGREKGEK